MSKGKYTLDALITCVENMSTMGHGLIPERDVHIGDWDWATGAWVILKQFGKRARELQHQNKELLERIEFLNDELSNSKKYAQHLESTIDRVQRMLAN